MHDISYTGGIKRQLAALGHIPAQELCNEPVDWDNPTVLKTMSGKNKRGLSYGLKLSVRIPAPVKV